MRERGITSPRSSVVRGVLHSLYILPVVVVVVVGRRRRRRQPYIDENRCIPRVSVLSAGPLACSPPTSFSRCWFLIKDELEIHE
jgi:hypothetical protein